MFYVENMTTKKIQNIIQESTKEEIVNCNRITKNFEQTCYHVETKKDEFIAIHYNAILKNEALILEANKIYSHLGFPFTKILKIKHINGKTLLLTTFCSGKQIKEWNHADYKNVGFLLSAIHKSIAKIPYKEKTLPLIDELSNRYLESEEFFPGELTSLSKKITLLQNNWPIDLPKGFIHSEICQKNVLFEDKNVSGITNILSYRYDTLLLDITKILTNFILKEDLNKLESFITSYEIFNPLSEKELEALPLLTETKIIENIIDQIEKSHKEKQTKQFHLKCAALNFIKLEKTKTFFAKNSNFSKLMRSRSPYMIR